jgi:uncharacterized membrane protein (GlpM family)
VTALVLRFLGAGTLVSILPWVASRFGEQVSGVILLFPAVTLAGLYVLGQERGQDAMASAAVASASALPVVLVFLVTVNLAARRGMPVPIVLATAVLAWFFAAASIVGFRAVRKRG